MRPVAGLQMGGILQRSQRIMRNVTSKIVMAVLLTTAGLGACKKGEDKAQHEADKARDDADQKARDAAKAAQDADAKAAAAAKETADAAAKDAADARDKLQKAIDASDRKASSLKEKLAKATGTVRKNADAAAAEVDKRRAAVNASLANLGSATGTAWATARTQVEADTAALDKSIDALETTLKK